ncbi:MAG: hypothetical protein ACOYBU_14040 [Dermatophilaceae bacterium]
MPRFWNSHSQAWRDFPAGQTPGYPYVAEDAMQPGSEGTQELAAKTADAILADVGEDAEMAQEALDAEQARDKPRTSLTAKLQKIIDAAADTGGAAAGG